MSIVIRSATIDDLDTLVALRIEYLMVHYGGLSDTDKVAIIRQVKEYISKEIGKGFLAVIAVDGCKAVSVAFMAISEKPANLSFMTGRVGTILNVFTFSEYRNRGIATEVLQSLISLAKQYSLSSIELSATPAGKALYKKLGFVEKKFVCTEMKLIL